MWLPERMSRNVLKTGFATGLCVVVAAVSGCTVRPLYSEAGLQTGALAGAETEAASVTVKPENTRFGLEVRNHLIFLLNGGSSEPANPAYSLELNVSAQSTVAAIVQRTKDSEPTAGVVTLTSVYKLTDSKTAGTVATGRRAVSSSYDIPRQEFAALRAERDAQNRAARELAELLRHAVAQELDKLGAPDS